MSKKRPYELLPLPLPAEYDPSEKDLNYFHDNFASAFIPDMIQMMSHGLHIDRRAVEKLRSTINTVLADVTKKLNRNPTVKKYQELRAKNLQAKHRVTATASVRQLSDFTKEYNPKDITHRTWVVNHFLKHYADPSKVKDKWAIKDIKNLQIWVKSPFLDNILNKVDISNYPYTLRGMVDLAEYKLELWNRPRYESANQPVAVPDFNPGSAIQKQELFEMLKLEPLSVSKKTGNASWGRDQLEELQRMTTNSDLLKLLQSLIDFSFSGIIKTNFLKAFDSYTVDGVLHGNVKLFGAKSFRLTSNSPNLLNAPSTGSIYAKPLKKCFIASDGRVIYTADLSALEDRVIANLSKDVNKLALFLEGLDGHSLSACYYFKERVEALVGLFDNFKNASRLLKALVDKKHAEAKQVRQDSKPVSFGLAYGAFPPKVSQAIRCLLEEAERIFDVYHQELFPGITEYREEYVLKTAQTQGYIHLGLGCRMYTSNPDKEIRSISNATVQFWSILTLIAVNELNHRIREAGLEDRMDIQSTIYDSIYVDVDNDPEVIKWLNDNIIEVMCVQYLEDEQIHNEAEGEIGKNWGELTAVPNNATVEEISTILEEI
jgi:hypothetical protein